MFYHDLPDTELNTLCCTRLGWELKPHLWEYGSVWHDRAWFKGETLMGYPNFLTQDPIPRQLMEELEVRGLQNRYAEVLFEMIEGHTLSHPQAWYRLAHATPRQRMEAFLLVTEPAVGLV
ncbi:hypothetical protein [Deinococcus roseus]|uniref:Uncharacterized protein n=1 Tax=Deinococcus roseus TaxID=392414 RepID=A0ABQ2CVU4_9DEIO|nr:hypothetical protein [Deinococcus roseus]GGJ25835.1 hypothetical protein GCM10008938_09930 [Deinococcus roseus]